MESRRAATAASMAQAARARTALNCLHRHPAPCAMPFTHTLLALLTVLIWGSNFVVIKWGLGEFPPLLFSTLRFALSALPWVFFIPRPASSWGRLFAAGSFLSVGQFGLLYWAMQGDISPGLASLVVQSQVFFTILLAVALRGEHLRWLQYAALSLAALGFLLVGWHGARDPAAAVTPWGLMLVLAAAFCWACANTLVRGAGRVNMLGFTLWSSLCGTVPIALASLLIEGPARIGQALAHADLNGWLAVLWQSLGNTILGFGLWNWLLARHPAGTVAPMAMLVPVVGMVSSAWLIGEAMPGWKLLAAVLVMGGLALNLYAGRLRERAKPAAA
jgi:O-acetylserine/cysteine efflux transporter